jgi:hypothetical protein
MANVPRPQHATNAAYRAEVISPTLDSELELEPDRGVHMGDKSPKAKDKAKKQDTANKDQKKANASNKVSAQVAKKGK